jgi:hypothetical protein
MVMRRSHTAGRILKDWKPLYKVGDQVIIVWSYLWTGCVGEIEAIRYESGKYYVRIGGKGEAVFHVEPEEENTALLKLWEEEIEVEVV